MFLISPFMSGIRFHLIIFFRISGLLFILISFYSVYKIRNIYDGEYIYFIFVLIICVFKDLIFGKILKQYLSK